MNEASIKIAIKEAEQFIHRAKLALKDQAGFVHDGRKISYLVAGKKSGALRRASMDLTRALADMRRP
jgi:hypothetical protein